MRYIYCDTCKEETLHEVVREDKNLYKCSVCGTHTVYVPEKEIKVRAIISTGAKSTKGFIRVREGDVIKKGEEYIVDTDEGHKIGEVTAIELKDGRRTDICEASKVSTVWLRDVGEVYVKFSLHKRAVTTPYKMVTDGETEFEVGEVLNIDGKPFRIHRIKLIDGGVLRRGKAKAKEIKRIYAKYVG